MASLGLCTEFGQPAPKKVAATPSSSGTTTIRIAPFGSTCASRALRASSSSDRVKTVRVVHRGDQQAIGELEFLNPGLFQDGSRAFHRRLKDPNSPGSCSENGVDNLGKVGCSRAGTAHFSVLIAPGGPHAIGLFQRDVHRSPNMSQFSFHKKQRFRNQNNPEIPLKVVLSI